MDAKRLGWISVNDALPETKQRVLVRFTNSHGNTWTTCADYIAPKSVLVEDYMDEDYCDGGCGEYDEENDCYWTESGWYEHDYVPETNWRLNEVVTHWAPISIIDQQQAEIERLKNLSTKDVYDLTVMQLKLDSALQTIEAYKPMEQEIERLNRAYEVLERHFRAISPAAYKIAEEEAQRIKEGKDT